MKANIKSFFFGLSRFHSKRMFSWLMVLFMVSSNLAWIPTAKAVELHDPGDVLINEFVSFGGGEWVELLNATDSSINLAGWTLEHTYIDMGPVTTSVVLSGTIPAYGIVVVTPPAMRDEGASLALMYPANEEPIFMVSYGDTQLGVEPHVVDAPGAGQSAILGAEGALSITDTPRYGLVQ